MQVLLLSRYGRLAPNSRLRSYQYIPFLKSHGIEVESEPLSSDRYLKNFYSGRPVDWIDIIRSYIRRIIRILKSRRFDLLWIEHELFPWFPGCWEFVLNQVGIPYMVDYDDAVFHRYDRHPRAPVRWLFGGKIDTVMRNASLVIAGNQYLADRAINAGAKRVEVLPTVVDYKRYRAVPPLKGKQFTIGWIGSPTTAQYIRVAEPALAELCNNGNARLVLIGSGPVTLTKVGATLLQWSEETEVQEVKKFDAGIMPLPDNAWTKGKCGYKLIQYMACALPVVASKVGVNREIVDHGKTGFLVSTTQEWVDSLQRLRNDPALRDRMGKRGQEQVMKKYSLQVTAPRLASLIKSCR